MKRVCSICARGGSKGLPGKNLKPLAGKSLVARCVEQAYETGLFDAVGVSSDSADILLAAREAGAEFLVERPTEMASDTASKLPPIRHLFETVEAARGVHFDTLVDIDVTSPLRAPEDVIGAVELMESRGVSNVITGSVARKNPYFNMVEVQPDGHVDLCKRLPGGQLARRQDCPVVYEMNAAVYVWRRDAFFEHMNVFYPDTLIYEMPEERSHDIDSALDFDFVEFLLTKSGRA